MKLVIESTKILESYTNFFVKLSVKNHTPKNITTTIFSTNIKNLHKFMIKDLKKLNNQLIKKTLNPVSINFVSRTLDVPRETIRRNILLLVNKNYLIRNQKGLFVSEVWIKKNIDKIVSEIKDFMDCNKKIVDELEKDI
jgi:predicted transcriptional regulator